MYDKEINPLMTHFMKYLSNNKKIRYVIVHL